MIIQPSEEGISLAKEILIKEDVLGLPTETVYGLAGLCLSDKAINKIFSLKNRPLSNPLILHAYDWRQLNEFAQVEEYWDKIQKIEGLVPGPLSLIIPKRDSLSDLVTASSEYVCVRIPASEICRELLKILPCPVAAPSANISGFTSCVTAQQVEKEFQGVIAVLDGGPCLEGIESTILSLVTEPPRIFRLGAVPAELLAEKLGISIEVLLKRDFLNSFPGGAKSHYRPRNCKVSLKERNIDGVLVQVAERVQKFSKIEFLRNFYRIIKDSDCQNVTEIEIYGSFDSRVFPDYVLLDRFKRMGILND